MPTTVFDTETDGIADYSKEIDDPSQPHILQLACLVYDDKGKEVFAFKTPIKPYGGRVVDERLVDDKGNNTAFSVNGITQEHLEKFGMPLADALAMFERCEQMSDLKVAHNYRFDGFLLKCAYAAAGLIQTDNPIEKYCTMKGYSDALGEKWPKLTAVYEKITGKALDNAHDSLADARACATLFFWLKKEGHFKPQPRVKPKAA